MTFNDILEARGARDHAVKDNKDVKIKKNEPKRFRVTYKWPRCSFVFYASFTKKAQRLQLKTFKVHNCPIHFKNKWISPTIIVVKYKRRMRTDPRWKLRDIKQTIKEEMGVDVTTMLCSRAKSIVMYKTQGCYTQEYSLLWTYAEEIRRRNEGSTVKIMVDRHNPGQQPLFKRMYICIDALKKGFLEGCRKIIVLDGCFLKGLCKGEILAAIGRDANDQLYLVAWCVVEVESRDSWDWFLRQLQDDLNIESGIGWSFISDQMKELVLAIA
ncbi:unnamed protein product [Linum trigynum]|uniref:MULE transposase domain-containing protein n=1 Tax=Linum trigynum TaxID=586398 RepID=A0AAV2EAC4_9ROSI